MHASSGCGLELSVKRPEEHVKDTRGTKIFSASVPDEWILRDVEHDYGIDHEIEIVETGLVSGKILFIQLKSSDTHSVENGVIKYQFETSKLQYYLKKDVPVIIVLVDLNSKKSYWLFAQEYVYEQIQKAKQTWTQQETITLKIPEGNVWSDCLSILRDIAFHGPFYLVMKRISSIESARLLGWRKNIETLSELEDFKERMGEKAQEIGLELSYRYSKEGKPEEAAQVAEKVYRESKAISINRLKAIAVLLWQYNPVKMDENREIFELASEGVETSQRLKSDANYLYFRGILKQTVFFKLADRLGNELLLRKVSEQTKGSITEPFLIVSASETTKALEEIKADFISTMDEATSGRHHIVFTDLLRRFALMQLFLYQNLIVFVDSKSMADLLNSAKAALELSLKIAESTGQVDTACVILEDFALYYHMINDVEMRKKVLTKCSALSRNSGHKGFEASCKEKIEHYEKAPPFITGPKDVPDSTQKDFDKLSDEEVDKMHRFILKKAGIDLDGNDEFARLARIGLRDRNPERVLKHCEHLYVEIVSYGPIWDMVGLTTTGQKILFCEKNGFIIGWELDAILGRFKKDYCSSCSFHSPRPEKWKWTYRWQRERVAPARMKKIIQNYRQS